MVAIIQFLVQKSRSLAMNSEYNSQNLFQPIAPEVVASIANKIPAIWSLFSHSPNQTPKINLKLVDNSLIMLEPNGLDLFLTLCFEVKFEVLFEQEKNILSRKIGIRLYDQSQRSIKLYSSEPVILEWILVLTKKINQFGFHEMFRPIRKLGKGNFATVYEAERLTDHQHFAVKAFSKQNSYNAKNGKASLINEINIMRELNHESHPNVLKLQAVFESENSIYVVLELLLGHTLFQKIQERKGQFNKEEVKQIMRGLLSALHHMHSRRIMHRDLKPENVMLRSGSLEPVIVDFGLATNADLKEYLFFRCGTPGYVAPEITQLTQSLHIEPICDMFSLGVIFHILLVKKALFEGTKYDEVYKNNKELKFKLQGDSFKSVEATALHLLKEMLVVAPSKRICARDALNHDFLRSTQMDIEGDLKISLPSSTDVSLSEEKKRKKTFFIF